jgi:hypothetical protein
LAILFFLSVNRYLAQRGWGESTIERQLPQFYLRHGWAKWRIVVDNKGQYPRCPSPEACASNVYFEKTLTALPIKAMPIENDVDCSLKWFL